MVFSLLVNFIQGKYLTITSTILIIIQNNLITLNSKKRILIVDDERDICLALKIVLEQSDFIVDYYYNPILALNEFKSNFYDLLVFDIKMFPMNGFELYTEIKKRDTKPKICFITAGEILDDIKFKLPYDYNIIKKPIENEELILTINNLLNEYNEN